MIKMCEQSLNFKVYGFWTLKKRTESEKHEYGLMKKIISAFEGEFGTGRLQSSRRY